MTNSKDLTNPKDLMKKFNHFNPKNASFYTDWEALAKYINKLSNRIRKEDYTKLLLHLN